MIILDDNEKVSGIDPIDDDNSVSSDSADETMNADTIRSIYDSFMNSNTDDEENEFENAEDYTYKSINSSISNDIESSNIEDNVSDNTVSSSINDNISDNITSSSIDDNASDNITSSSIDDNVSDNITSSSIDDNVSDNITSSSINDNVSDNIIVSNIGNNVSLNYSSIASSFPEWDLLPPGIPIKRVRRK